MLDLQNFFDVGSLTEEDAEEVKNALRAHSEVMLGTSIEAWLSEGKALEMV